MTRHCLHAATQASVRPAAGRASAGLLRAGLLAALIGTALVPALPALAQDAAKPAAAAATQGDDPVLATVNGTPIRRSDVTAAAAELAPNLPQQIQGAARDEYVLGFLIDLNAMAQAAEAEKLYETDAFKREMDFIRKRVLMQAILEKATKAALTDEAMQQTYKEAVAQQKPEQEVHARHILFRADPADKDASAAAEKKAEDVEARLKKGEDFAKLAGELTEDPSGKKDGGDLGFFTKEQMVPEFAEVAFALKPGEVSKPVKTQFGWHVIKLEEVRERPVPTFEEVKPQIEQFVAQKAQAEVVQKTRDAAKVEKTEAAPKPADLITQPAAPATPAP
ncbi:peptidylprolyl isomerase [Ancylobacter dichloromethanicus]|uniref:Parvulin-like PPIase n=1 Tax=Ancylobacter dichloromethanicus TaxID=518825 RepID=A0A9W6J4N1_9HYPH|nr:peptidylprolyl isomerase [Ancylobacter dichloromethanicus]MBS7555557.1 peptidylprolyl isomerase [Ancylobacter dichloromethanicus]GLK70756.1 peptidylprolyl isomerase [Ancylobacter dichloromethanicus]